MIWTLSGSLRLSQNFVKNWKFSWPRSLAKFQILTTFWTLLFCDLWVNCKRQNSILKYSFVDLKDFWKFEVEAKFCQKLKIFMTAVLSEISDFDHFLNIVIFDLWVNCKCQNGILKCFFVDLNYFWKFEVFKNFVKNWKFSWPRSLAKFPILSTFWTLSFLTCEWIAGLKLVF